MVTKSDIEELLQKYEMGKLTATYIIKHMKNIITKIQFGFAVGNVVNPLIINDKEIGGSMMLEGMLIVYWNKPDYFIVIINNGKGIKLYEDRHTYFSYNKKYDNMNIDQYEELLNSIPLTTETKSAHIFTN